MLSCRATISLRLGAGASRQCLAAARPCSIISAPRKHYTASPRFPAPCIAIGRAARVQSANGNTRRPISQVAGAQISGDKAKGEEQQEEPVKYDPVGYDPVPPVPRERLALLYVPGSSQKMVDKAAASGADTIIYDLEDSVAPEAKQQARNIVVKALQGPCGQKQEKAVRINSIASDDDNALKDLRAILPCPGLDTIVMPKVEWPFEIDTVRSEVGRFRPRHLPMIQIILSIESPGALLKMQGLLSNFYMDDGRPYYGEVYSTLELDGIAGLLFASEDYCAATGIQRSRSRKELLFPRAHIATLAKAHGIAAYDMVCIDYKDEAYLREESLEGRSLGMDGKQAIHPSQVATIQKAYLPSEDDIERAVRIHDAYQKSLADRKGAVGLQAKDGSTIMIDAPMLKQARTTLRKARAAGLDVPDPETL